MLLLELVEIFNFYTEAERAASAKLGLAVDLAAKVLGQLLAKAEAKADAIRIVFLTRFNGRERFEQTVHVFRLDSNPIVHDFNTEHFLVLISFMRLQLANNFDVALPSELVGIADVVLQNLVDSLQISSHVPWHLADEDLMDLVEVVVHLACHDLNHIFNLILDIEHLQARLEHVLVQQVDVEQLIHLVQQKLGAAHDGRHEFLALSVANDILGEGVT